MKKIIVSLVFFFSLTALFAQAPRPFPVGLPTCLEDDFRELEKFYDATGGNNWKDKTGWFTNPDLGKWYGIKLTENGCDAKEFNLSSNKLKGKLIDIKLNYLRVFNCNNNELDGNIPDFQNFPNLQLLNCVSNELSGNIPNFTKLPNLQAFSCYRNKLTGIIPNFTNLLSLQYFSCYSNKLTGSIPDFTNLPNLADFYCSWNELAGTIPDFINLPNLQNLECSGNQLTGNITNFTKLPNLLVFDCSRNRLTGNIPDYINLPNLSTFNCNSNQLTGNITNFTNLSNLLTFDCSNNQIRGNIPDFTNLPNLQKITCFANQLTDPIPNFAKIPNLEELICGYNQLDGTIPDFTNLPNLSFLDCGYNQLTGNIPDFTKLPNLKHFNCNNNKLTGSIPKFSKLPNLTKFFCSYNQLTGNIPIVPNLLSLVLFDINGNLFNFGNIESFEVAANGLLYYVSQRTILPITYKSNGLIADTAGTNLNKLTYKWFRNNVLFETTSKNLQSPKITESGKYHYSVQDSVLKDLTLFSESITIGAKLSGKLFRDSDKNCTFGTGDKAFPNAIIRFENAKDTVYASTDSQGNYDVVLDTFKYTISLKINTLWKSCLLPSVKFNDWNETKIQNIPMQSVTDCPYLTVDIATQRLLRCFDNTYTVRYDNLGTQSAQNAYIVIDFDKYLTVKTATKPFTKLANNRYRFDVGAVDFADPKTFNVVVKVDCDSTVLGQTHCTTAHIYPDTICDAPSSWDKSSIAVTGNCQGGKVNFDIKNVGKAPTSQPTQYFVIEDQIFTLQSQPFNLSVGEVKNVSIAATGKTYRLVAKQAAFHPSGNTFATAAIEGCGTTPISFGFVTQYSDGDAEPYLDVDCRQNVGSYDPNEKLASPKGLGTQRLIEKNTDIEYQINFQNEGSDTAYTVVVKDNISKLLNISTLKMGVSSHSYTWKIDEQGELTVTFDKINLTAKKKDEAKSQGFFEFRIAQQKDLAIGTVINNKAEIYFDFNLPIITNTTLHRIGKEYFTVAIPEAIENQSLKVNIFPNPFQYSTTFQVESGDDEQFSLQIINTQGSIIHQQAFDEKQLILEKNLSSGIYFYQIKGNKSSRSSGKLLVVQ